MRFHKYQALGNDYVVIERDERLDAGLVRRICDRHYGIGSDGVLVSHGRDQAGRFRLEIVNPDGTEAEKSGNGLRIYSRYLWDQERVGDGAFLVVTKGGTVTCEVRDSGRSVFVEMGRASFDSRKIPVQGCSGDVIERVLTLADEGFRVTCVTIGNPHCVIPCKEALPQLARKFGPAIEHHLMFPNRTNVQFMERVDRHQIRIEIWERGAGYTLASGSSSCAAAAAAVRLGLCETPITVSMPGGELEIQVAQDYSLTMLGPVAKVAEGELASDLLETAADSD